MSLYHVTSKENALKIREEQDFESDYNRTKRREMHSLIDEFSEKDNWCDRKGAIFAWTTFQKAKKYSKNFVEEGILEIELKEDSNPWCIEDFVIEDTYSRYLDNKELSEQQLEDILEWSRPWDGEENNDLEVWFRSEDVKSVNVVYDSFGNIIG